MSGSSGRGIDTRRRRAVVLDALASSGEVRVPELAARLDVSEMTVRRDLEQLERDGLVVRVRGGAIPKVSGGYEPPREQRELQNPEVKARLAETAAALVSDGETAALDVGSTMLALARALRRGPRRLTVVTASIPIALELSGAADVRVLISGGLLRPGELSCVGGIAEDTFTHYNCDVAFVGVAGMDATRGLTEYNIDDARVKQRLVHAARRKVAVADSSKAGKAAFAKFADWEDVDVLVTDADPDHPACRAATKANVRVIRPEDD